MRHATEETTISKDDLFTNARKEEGTKEEEPNEMERREKAELADELEVVMVNNLMTRTFSTRRRVAVMSALEKVDEIEYVDPQHKENEGHSQSGKFLDTVNNELKKKDNDDEVSVSIKVVEKRMIEPATIEVASVAYMIIFGSSANNFVDGMSMGTLAILINSGLGFRRALLFNMIPIFLSYLGFVCGVLLDNVDEGYDDYIFSISSGMYMYIFLGTLIPEIRESCNELIKENMPESLLVTLLQFLGISSGILFMYYMSTIGGVEF
uniref:Na_Ca_ex domain-containing protein n=1 Tax=Heterorhabditis bacteriophora TaxID=37862 RepID=A0A1I7XLR3_HETBA